MVSFGFAVLIAVGWAALIANVNKDARPKLDLWPNGNPEGWSRSDQETSERDPKQKFLIVKGVSKPTLEIFRAPNAMANAPTVLICPGGGYYVLAIEHEGWEIAQRLNKAGIHAAVLKYRLPNREADKPLWKPSLQDAQRGLRLLRAHAAEFGLNPNRIGLMGFSAGGHLTAVTSATREDSYRAKDAVDKLSARPNFSILIYPAYLNVPDKLEVAPEVKPRKDNPPVFVVQTLDDGIPVEGALSYTVACKKEEVLEEIHLFPRGGHGYGLRSKEKGISTWPTLMVQWIRRLYPQK